MGLSSSQVRLLQLTSRKNDIGCELILLSNQRQRLANDMQKVSQKYNNALNSKVYKWTTNNGLDYIDLSYKALMRPASTNSSKPYLLSDNSGKIIIDEAYRKYAEMLSPDGSPVSWGGETRLKILEGLTGIKTADLSNYDNANNQVLKAKENLNNIGPAPEKSGLTTGSVQTFVAKGGYDYNGVKEVSGASDFRTLIGKIKDTYSTYMTDDNLESFKTTCDNVANSNDKAFQNKDASSALVKEYKDDKYVLDMSQVFGMIFGDQEITWVSDRASYNNWKQKNEAYKTQQQKASDAYENAVATRNAIFTADQESMIRFYDEVFSTIAENGWIYNNNVNDEDYLNQQLQNNQFTITTIDRDHNIDENGNITSRNSYNTTIASNCDKLTLVNDNEARAEALAEYEYEKSLINKKETKIDTREANLNTEMSTINQMKESIEKQIQDNIERTMNIFS